MPQFLQRPPDPGFQSLVNYASQAQYQRYQEQMLRKQERAEQNQRAIVAGTMAVAAVGGAFIGAAGASAPASQMGSSLTATGGIGGLPMGGLGAMEAAGLSASGITAGSAALTGAFQGARYGNMIGNAALQFESGDVAGGANTLMNTAGSIMQNIEDHKLYGYTPTDEERSLYFRQMLDLGISPRKARQQAAAGGPKIPDLISTTTLQTASDDKLTKIFASEGLPFDGPTGRALADEAGQDMPTFVAEQKHQLFTKELVDLEQREAAKVFARSRAERAVTAMEMGLKTELDVATYLKNQDEEIALEQAYMNGEATLADLTAARLKRQDPPVIHKPRVDPPAKELLDDEVYDERTGRMRKKTFRGGKWTLDDGLKVVSEDDREEVQKFLDKNLTHPLGGMRSVDDLLNLWDTRETATSGVMDRMQQAKRAAIEQAARQQAQASQPSPFGRAPGFDPIDAIKREGLKPPQQKKPTPPISQQFVDPKVKDEILAPKTEEGVNVKTAMDRINAIISGENKNPDQQDAQAVKEVAEFFKKKKKEHGLTKEEEAYIRKVLVPLVRAMEGSPK